MTQFFKKLKEVDPNNTEAVKDVLSTFFQNLSKHADTGSSLWLQNLQNIINRFPKYCGTHRHTIEAFLSKFVDSDNYFNVIGAAKCAHILQQVRPQQEKSASAKVCWREHLFFLCNVANELISELFSDSVDIYKGGTKKQKLQLESTDQSPLYSSFTQIDWGKTQGNQLNKLYILSTKLKNVFIFLQAALVEIYPVAKPVQPQLVFEVIVRALSVSSGVKTNLDVSTIASIKIQALRTLDALVICLGPNLIPFSPLIFKFVIQTLKWTTDNATDDSRSVRCAAYGSISRWLRVVNVCRVQDSLRDGGDGLVAHLLADVAPAAHVLTLTLNSQPTKNMSKKAKRKMANSMLMESSIAAHAPGEKNKIPTSVESNDEVAIAALEFAETFILVCGIFLKPATYKLITERIVKECYKCQSYSMERSICLLRVLEALRKAGPGSAPPPTQYCLQLYSVLLNSGLDQITRFCSEALLDIRLHLHCAPASLNFALEAQEKQAATEKRKKISDKNLAALASLLGNHRVPVEDKVENIPDEIIDISEEPASKRARPSSEIDRISLSSDSSDSDDALVIEDSELAPEDDNAKSNEAVVETNGSLENDDCLAIETVPNNTDSAGTQDPDIEEVCLEVGKDLEKDICLEVGKNVETQKDSVENEILVSESIEKSPLVEASDVTDTTQKSFENIYDAITQMPCNASNDTVDGDQSPVSMEVEVTYDFPNTGKEKVTVLDKIEDEPLPSTNDTDDIQITCGQIVKSSQDVEIDKIKESGAQEGDAIKVNGDKSPEKDVVCNELPENQADKIVPKEVDVNDMLADFVDEVVDENKSEA